jgi:hypothetical protein
METRTMSQFIFSWVWVRKFHIEILDLSSWVIYWKQRRKSADANSVQQSFVYLRSRRWGSQNVTRELRVLGGETF